MPNTTNFAWNMPTEFADSDTWGGELNALFNFMDAATYSLATNRNFATVGGTVDALTLTTDTPANTLVEGQEYRFKAAGANTTGMTLNADGLGATAIKYADGSAIPAGGVQSGYIYTVTYNGSYFVLGGGSSASPASAAETLTGTDVVKFLTAGGLAGNSTLNATAGTYALPGGFRINWFNSSTAITSESSVNATWAVAFGTACVFAIGVPMNPSGSSGNDGFLQTVSMSTTGAVFRAQDVGGSLTGFTSIGIGY